MSVDYQAYLASREWSIIREAVRERSNNRCERCWQAPQQAVHHMTYENVGHESLDELLAVCRPCHAWLSGKSDDDPAETWLGAVMFLPTHTDAAWLFPDGNPRDGLRLGRRNEPLPLSLFVYSATIERAVADAWFVGYHVAEDSNTESPLITGWFAPADVVERAPGFDGSAESADEAWGKFIDLLSRYRRPGWGWVPDDRFNIYGARR